MGSRLEFCYVGLVLEGDRGLTEVSGLLGNHLDLLKPVCIYLYRLNHSDCDTQT
jgi:hypothetical protein